MATNILKNKILIGRVLPALAGNNNVKVQIPHFVYDEYFKAYFEKREEVIALDKKALAKTGDTVLISKMEGSFDKKVTHLVKEVVSKLGDVKDPFTGESVVGSKYRTQMNKEDALYGKRRSFRDFDYDTAPERGWQSGKRDFSDKPTYRKWHNFKKEDPYALLS
ncbi:unnamed protein product [Lepeophtheirus salmonis]|uniref:(salmon louse) hypothetical protein n=1 Tax=Lepeophtheirus salmonis TaxID=72036 RepID=C1BUV0_LEPSM|nr:28S ribosomal protein S17, mitochondrial-like [Lepeophtheirus salmonis]ACO12803.1 Mitochondrial 28S ribosomal protein S17 [Lepeophtheirus salmonis]ADD38380.1 28S ribosomal protein S17, mitochondrial [Lepeophtheirus salmonis]CAB4068043.1 unnamed protein product [Lepeophtheirus salmonis]CAF3000483.1 unnamed protein product [Lepeophtheirus salmonis]